MPLLASTLVLLLAPVPLAHFAFHAFLPLWRKRPAAFYLVAVLLWVAVAAVLWTIPLAAPLFAPSAVLRAWGAVFAVIGAIFVLWAIAAIHPKRFFLWAALRPESMPQVRIGSGPYRLLVHPAYVGYQLVAFGAFLLSGTPESLALAGWLLIAMPVLIRVEERELGVRLAGGPSQMPHRLG